MNPLLDWINRGPRRRGPSERSRDRGSRSRSRPWFALAGALVGLVAAIAVAGLWHLGATAQMPDAPVELTMLMHVPEAQQWRAIAARFEAENPDLRLKIIEGPSATNAIEDLHTAAFILGDSPYDLIYLDVAWVPKFAAAGWLMDLRDRLTPAQLANYLPGDVAGGRYRDGLYRLPFRTDMGMLYYRKDLLDAAGLEPPETFADLIAASEQLQRSRQVDWGYLWQGKQYEGLSAMFVEVLAGFGGFWVDPQTQAVGLDQPAAIAAVDFLQTTIAQGISPPGTTTYTEPETLRFFRNGNSAFLRNWPYVWNEVNRPDSPIRGQVAIAPMVHGPGQPSGACQGGWGLGISRATAHPDAAWRALEFFGRADVQKQFVLENSYVSSIRALADDPEIQAAYPQYRTWIKILDNYAVLRPPVPQYAQASDILQRYLTAAFAGSMTPTEAMAAAARETRSLLGTA